MLNVDTHIVVDVLAGRLRAEEKQLLRGQEWAISAIVLWEIYKLTELGKLRLNLDDSAFNRDLNRIPVWPITTHVCRQLRRLDFRGDPADEIIAATSIAYDAPLLTRDTRLLSSKVVPLALG